MLPPLLCHDASRAARRALILSSTFVLAAAGSARAQQRVSDLAETTLSRISVKAFGDINVLRDTDGSNTFALGQIDCFTTAVVSERWTIMTEVVAESEQDNSFHVDVERMLVQFAFNDFFRIAAGPYHTALGYYTTTFHEASWFQLAATRPFLAEFEEHAGLLPVHQVGVTMEGHVPSGVAGLLWIAEVSNGRAAAFSKPVQNTRDVDGHKAVNVSLRSRPGALMGADFGVSVYHDRVDFLPAQRMTENIVIAHAMLDRAEFQWLNEVGRISHTTDEGLDAVTTSWYTQIGKRVGQVTPFFRYQRTDAPDEDPIYQGVGERHAWTVGVRYDPVFNVGLKFQYDRETVHDEAGHRVTAQAAFTF